MIVFCIIMITLLMIIFIASFSVQIVSANSINIPIIITLSNLYGGLGKGMDWIMGLAINGRGGSLFMSNVKLKKRPYLISLLFNFHDVPCGIEDILMSHILIC